MNNKNISLNYYNGCIDNKRSSIEQKYQDKKYQFFADLARNSGIGTYGSRQRAKKIIDIKKKLIKEIIILMEECSIESLGKKSPKELTEEEFDFIGNKIEKDFLEYVNEKITSSDELKNDGNIAQYGLAKAFQEIDEEAQVLIDNIKGKFELIKQEKEILKQKIKIENLIAEPDPFIETGYGYGIHLSWNKLPLEHVKHYRIQKSKDRKNWEDVYPKREAQIGPWANIHGNKIFKEDGKTFKRCLPSGQTLYLKVIALDINGEPITEEIVKGTVSKYPVSFTESKIKSPYVDKKRIEELKQIKNSPYDTTKLVRLCEELNICYSDECILAIPMLLRAILDHVPPIFGKDTFNEVVNNYNWSRSKKKIIIRLHGSKDISDYCLHEHIENKEALPNLTQVDFKNELDVLLQEIVIKLKD